MAKAKELPADAPKKGERWDSLHGGGSIISENLPSTAASWNLGDNRTGWVGLSIPLGGEFPDQWSAD